MDIYGLAEVLHAKLCRDSHMDRCSWDYEKMPGYPTKLWASWAHKQYLEKAQDIYHTTGLDMQDIAKVIKAL